MKRFLIVLAGAAALLAPAAASAHPLGNFTTNLYSRVELSGDRLYVLHVVDLAEIPTYQAAEQRRALGASGYAQRLAQTVRAGLTLRVNGRPRVLRELDRSLVVRKGAAGLRTTRLETVFDAGTVRRGTDVRVSYADRNFRDRIGWREVVVSAGSGAAVERATAARRSVSDELRTYPNDLLSSPLDVSSANVRFSAGDT